MKSWICALLVVASSARADVTDESHAQARKIAEEAFLADVISQTLLGRDLSTRANIVRSSIERHRNQVVSTLLKTIEPSLQKDLQNPDRRSREILTKIEGELRSSAKALNADLNTSLWEAVNLRSEWAALSADYFFSLEQFIKVCETGVWIDPGLNTMNGPNQKSRLENLAGDGYIFLVNPLSFVGYQLIFGMNYGRAKREASRRAREIERYFSEGARSSDVAAYYRTNCEPILPTLRAILELKAAPKEKVAEVANPLMERSRLFKDEIQAAQNAFSEATSKLELDKDEDKRKLEEANTAFVENIRKIGVQNFAAYLLAEQVTALKGVDDAELSAWKVEDIAAVNSAIDELLAKSRRLTRVLNLKNDLYRKSIEDLELRGKAREFAINSDARLQSLLVDLLSAYALDQQIEPHRQSLYVFLQDLEQSREQFPILVETYVQELKALLQAIDQAAVAP